MTTIHNYISHLFPTFQFTPLQLPGHQELQVLNNVSYVRTQFKGRGNKEFGAEFI